MRLAWWCTSTKKGASTWPLWLQCMEMGRITTGKLCREILDYLNQKMCGRTWATGPLCPFKDTLDSLSTRRRSCDVTRGNNMSTKGKFAVITGLWRRRKNNGNEVYYYGKPKLTEPLVINPGDEIYIFSTSARNASGGDPAMYCKVKRKTETTDAE